MKLRNALIHLAYPFSHALYADPRNQRIQYLDKTWSHWWKRLDDAAIARVIDDSYFFLPHVREKLFPETALLEKGSASDVRRSGKAILKGPLAEVANAFGKEGVLRLTLDASLLQALHPLQPQFQPDGASSDDNFQGALGIEWIDLALFPQGVGFLILNVLPDSKDLNVDRLNDYLYYLWPIHAPSIGWQLAQWQRGDEQHGLSFQSVDVDYLLQGFSPDENPIETDFESYLKSIRGNPDLPRHTQNPEGQIYGESFREYTYACVDSSEPSFDSANLEQKSEQSAALFSSASDRALYELATCTRTQDPEFNPASASRGRPCRGFRASRSIRASSRTGISASNSRGSRPATTSRSPRRANSKACCARPDAMAWPKSSRACARHAPPRHRIDDPA